MRRDAQVRRLFVPVLVGPDAKVHVARGPFELATQLVVLAVLVRACEQVPRIPASLVAGGLQVGVGQPLADLRRRGRGRRRLMAR